MMPTKLIALSILTALFFMAQAMPKLNTKCQLFTITLCMIIAGALMKITSGDGWWFFN